jgi:hypothetical protein
VAFESFWEELLLLARKHGERVADRNAWREEYDAGKSAKDAFYAEYPEHLPAVISALSVDSSDARRSRGTKGKI